MNGQRYANRPGATGAGPEASSQAADPRSALRSPPELDARVLAAARAAVAPGHEQRPWLGFVRRHPWLVGLAIAGALALALAFAGIVPDGSAVSVSEIIPTGR